MFVDPQIHIYLTVLLVVLYYLIPPYAVYLRLGLVITVSALLIFYAAPHALIAVAGLSIFTAMMGRYLSSGTASRGVFALALTMPVLVVLGFDYASSASSLIVTLGVSYFALKSAMVLADCRKGRLEPNVGGILALNMFYPIYSAGPIERARSFDPARFQAEPQWHNLGYGAARVVIGLFLSSYVAHGLIDGAIAAHFGQVTSEPAAALPWQIYLYLLLAFLSLYIAFAGYTDIAVGTARLLGIEVAENFRLPLFATSIQNFWQRWHLSLSSAVSDYLFKPMVRHTGRPMLAIFVAFLVVGLWHRTNPQYLIWGAAHGAALAMNFRYARYCQSRPWLTAIHANPAVQLISMLITISFVGTVSGFANAKDLETAAQMLGRLVGIM